MDRTGRWWHEYTVASTGATRRGHGKLMERDAVLSAWEACKVAKGGVVKLYYGSTLAAVIERP